MLKKLLLMVSIGYTITLIIITLINMEDMPDLGSSFDDKIYHVAAYVVLGFLWITYVRFSNSKQKIVLPFSVLLLFGITLELSQHQINPNRTYDHLDLLSNCLGVILGTIIAVLLNRHKLNIFKALLF